MRLCVRVSCIKSTKTFFNKDVLQQRSISKFWFHLYLCVWGCHDIGCIAVLHLLCIDNVIRILNVRDISGCLRLCQGSTNI